MRRSTWRPGKASSQAKRGSGTSFMCSSYFALRRRFPRGRAPSSRERPNHRRGASVSPRGAGSARRALWSILGLSARRERTAPVRVTLRLRTSVTLLVAVICVLLAAAVAGAFAPAAAAAPGAAQIDDFLAAHGSPLTGAGATFVAEGRAYGVDPAFLVAISGAETSFGQLLYAKNGDQCTYNAFNWFFGPTWPQSDFGSWDEAIGRVAEGLAGELYYGAGLYSAGAIADLVSDQAVTLAPDQPLAVSASWPLDTVGEWHGWIEVVQNGSPSLVGEKQAFAFRVSLPRDLVVRRWIMADTSLSSPHSALSIIHISEPT